jgi:short-subunit dehydrogenase
VALPADIASAEERAALPERVAAALGPLDILVNNAGLLAGGELARLTPEQIEAAVAVNLLAPMLLARHCLDDLARRRGAIVLVGSMMSLVPIPAAPLYSATKAGLYAFGESLRYELRPRGIHLLTALPPGTATAMTAAMARRAPRPTRLADPGQLGGRIVAALASRRERVQWGAGERALTWLYRWAPGLARPLLGRSRGLWARLLNEPDE